MRFNDLLLLVATPAPRLDRGDSLGRRMGDLQHPVSSLQPRCRIPVRFPSSQTTLSPYIPLSAPSLPAYSLCRRCPQVPPRAGTARNVRGSRLPGPLNRWADLGQDGWSAARQPYREDWRVPPDQLASPHGYPAVRRIPGSGPSRWSSWHSLDWRILRPP